MGSKEKRQLETPEGPVFLAPESYTRPDDPAREPLLLGNRCAVCRRVFFPARSLCPDCFEQGPMEPLELSGRGRVHASTVVRIPAPVGIAAPYSYGYVELEESGVRVFALFSGADPQWFQPGREVRLEVGPIRKDDSGREVIGYKFRPAQEGSAHE